MLSTFSRFVSVVSLFLAVCCFVPSTHAAQIFSGAQVWFRADQGVLKPDNSAATTSGDAVATWQTQIGSLDVTQSDAGKRPTYQTNALNGLPAISFTSDVSAAITDGLHNTTTNAVPYGSPRTILVAGKAAVGTTVTGGTLIGFGRTAAGNKINTESLMNYSGTFYVFSDAVTVNGNLTGSVASLTTEIQSNYVTTFKTTVGSQIGVDLNGLSRGVSGGVVAAETSLSPGFSIGSRDDYLSGNGTFDYNGLIGEVLVYDRVLNTAENTIANNYLSAKYDSVLASNDKYHGDDAAKNHYDFEVFGIGQDVATSNGSPAGSVTTGTAGTGLTLTAANGSLSSGDYLLAGQRAGVNSLTSSDVPTTDNMRWSRVWYLEQTGALDATLTFDFTDSGLASMSGPFKLLYSATDPFSFTELSTTATIVGDQVSFTLLSGQLLNGYYTLEVAPPAPEPSTLLLAAAGLLALRSKRRSHARAK